jgi:glucan 1,3-beta-glucosidase
VTIPPNLNVPAADAVVTVFFPPNLRVVGEAMSSVILGAGPRFSDINKPYPVLQVGKPGDKGYLEFSEVFVSTQGATAGAVLIEYNLATHTGSECKLTSQSTPPSGMWDVHTRYVLLL